MSNNRQLGIPIGISQGQRDLERFRQDSKNRQVRELGSLTYKDKNDIARALATLQEENPQDDSLAVGERIIRFLQILH